jgi:TatD DNase family protein
MYFVDTHTHLYLEQFNGDRNHVVDKAIENGIKKMLLPNIDSGSIQDLLNLCNDYPNNCFPMMGLHPTSVKENYIKELDTIEKTLFDNPKKYCAVGEIGIDLYWDKTFFSEQKEAFLKQIDWATELQLPIVIHARDSFEVIFETIEPKISPDLTGVFHSFTGTLEQARKIIGWGFKIGIGGIVTFKKAGLDAIVKEIPLEHIILETDSPFLTPTPFRGKRNESSYINYIAKKISEIYEVEIDEVAKITTSTAENLFKLKN